MTTEALQARIVDVFVRHLHIQPPSAEADLIESGAIDSLTFVELIAHLEQEFSIRIPLDELDLSHFRSIAQMANFIEANLAEREASRGRYSAV